MNTIRCTSPSAHPGRDGPPLLALNAASPTRPPTMSLAHPGASVPTPYAA
jgi:hypothetical protein